MTRRNRRTGPIPLAVAVAVSFGFVRLLWDDDMPNIIG
jgi:hypothetical protein